jgi:hypothetical protein
MRRKSLLLIVLVVLGCYVWANDLIHWQTTLRTHGIASLAPRLRAEKLTMVSPGVVPLAEGRLGFTAGLLVRDPDGHAMQVIER